MRNPRRSSGDLCQSLPSVMGHWMRTDMIGQSFSTLLPSSSSLLIAGASHSHTLSSIDVRVDQNACGSGCIISYSNLSFPAYLKPGWLNRNQTSAVSVHKGRQNSTPRTAGYVCEPQEERATVDKLLVYLCYVRGAWATQLGVS